LVVRGRDGRDTARPVHTFSSSKRQKTTGGWQAKCATHISYIGRSVRELDYERYVILLSKLSPETATNLFLSQIAYQWKWSGCVGDKTRETPTPDFYISKA
jgi:mannose/cellobiose epimerase-like protein (N-acyl-D-glucosamine 2-epimerase family)